MLGHEVEFAEQRSGDRELPIGKGCGKAVGIVILDLTIRGGMGGLETLQRLQETDPGVKSVVSSGYADDSSMSEYGKQGFTAVLKKPYELAELGDVLTTLMEEKS
jgi:DNA-binding NtrC family response regulator